MISHDILQNKNDTLSLVEENIELADNYKEYSGDIIDELSKYDDVEKDDLYESHLYEVACYIQFREHVSPRILGKSVATRHRQIESIVDMKYGNEITDLSFIILDDLYARFYSLFSYGFDIYKIITCKLLAVKNIKLLEKSLMELSEDTLINWFEFMNLYHLKGESIKVLNNDILEIIKYNEYLSIMFLKCKLKNT